MSAGLSLRAAVESVVGPASFVDLSFPQALLIGEDLTDGGQILRRPAEGGTREFLARFRQAGGHAAVPVLDDDSTFEWPPKLAGFDGAGTIVVGFAGPADAAALSDRLCHPGTALLVAEGGAAARRNLRGYRSMRLTDGSDGFTLYVPREAAPSGFGEPVELAAREGTAVVEARALIHDGPYVSEGDSKYSWLWTGAATHFRIIVPLLRGRRPRQVEVCVPRTEDLANLERLAVQIDGRPVPHVMDRWSETSGKVVVDLPQGDGYAALTLVIPFPARDANSGRVLGICIDKLILIAS